MNLKLLAWNKNLQKKLFFTPQSELPSQRFDFYNIFLPILNILYIFAQSTLKVDVLCTHLTQKYYRNERVKNRKSPC